MAYRDVQFGTTYGSLATVGYRLRVAGTWGSRITAGVTEVTTGSGTYSADVDESSLPTGIMWDTTDGSTVNAIETLAPQYVSSGTGAGQIDVSAGRVALQDGSIDPSTITTDFGGQLAGDMTGYGPADLAAAVAKVLAGTAGSGSGSSGSDIY